MNNIKEIKEELIRRYLGIKSEGYNVVGAIYSTLCIIHNEESYIFITKDDKDNNLIIIESNKNIFFKISESGNIIFSFQHYEKDRNEVKQALIENLNEFVFHNLILKEKLEFKLEPTKKEKVKKI